jgi:hypothetical protein
MDYSDQVYVLAALPSANELWTLENVWRFGKEKHLSLSKTSMICQFLAPVFDNIPTGSH